MDEYDEEIYLYDFDWLNDLIEISTKNDYIKFGICWRQLNMYCDDYETLLKYNWNKLKTPVKSNLKHNKNNNKIKFDNVIKIVLLEIDIDDNIGKIHILSPDEQLNIHESYGFDFNIMPIIVGKFENCFFHEKSDLNNIECKKEKRNDFIDLEVMNVCNIEEMKEYEQYAKIIKKNTYINTFTCVN